MSPCTAALIRAVRSQSCEIHAMKYQVKQLSRVKAYLVRTVKKPGLVVLKEPGVIAQNVLNHSPAVTLAGCVHHPGLRHK
jgi:hypothetical protein